MTSKVEIISLAFNLLGHKSIDSIDVDATPIVRSASVLYDVWYKSELTKHEWRFAMLRRSLNKLTLESDISRYKNIFQIPADCLKPYHVIPNSDYEIYEDKIFSNMDELTLVYNGLVDETHMPPYFVTFFIEKMAGVLAMPVTQQPKLVEIWGQSSMLNLKIAKALDAGSRTTVVAQRDAIYFSKFGTSGISIL